jgi:hypothetical protein
MEPTQAELVAIVDVSSLMDWACVDDTVPAPPASGPAIPSLRASFLKWASLGPSVHFRALAMMTPEEFRKQLAGWKYEGADPPMGATMSVLVAQQTARYICKLDEWPSEAAAAAKAAASAQLALATSSAGQPTCGYNIPPSSLVNVPTIKIGKILDQKLGEEITYLPNPDLQAMYSRYIRIMEEKPASELAVTTEQLTALKHILDSGRVPYADFAVWGPHMIRFLKRKALEGAVFDAKGVLHAVEMYGPPTIDSWTQCYNCLETAFIMLDTVSRPNISAYRKHVANLAVQFGPKVWHLLYQTDVRCRQELMEAVKMQLFEEHNSAVAQNQHSSFDVNRPWDAVWKAVITDPANLKWWNDQFERPAFLILTRTSNMDSMINEDEAQVAAKEYGNSPGAHHAQPPGPHVAKSGKKKRGQKVALQATTSNRRGRKICSAFQDGSCAETIGSATCAVDQTQSHQCANCLLPGHGAYHPKKCTNKKAVPNDQKGNKGGGSGKGAWNNSKGSWGKRGKGKGKW